MRSGHNYSLQSKKNTGINDEERWKDNPPEARGELEIAAASEPIVPGSGIMRI